MPNAKIAKNHGAKADGKKEAKARNVLALDSDLSAELRDAAGVLGAENGAALARLALRHVFARIKAGQLVNLNGQLTEVSAIPGTAGKSQAA